MPKITRSQIDRRLTFLRSNGCDLSIDKDDTGFRVQDRRGARNLSPRMKTTRETINWLEAYETGYEMGRETVQAARIPKHIPQCDCEMCSADRMRKSRESGGG